MSENTVVHSTFRIERPYKHAAARVFSAFADPIRKRRWFAEGEGWVVEEFTVDFRVHGVEVSRFRFRGGPEITNHTLYTDIVPERRIVTAYTMAVGGKRISSSLGTIEIAPSGQGSQLTYTEQAAFLDGGGTASEREEGCRGLFDALDRELTNY